MEGNNMKSQINQLRQLQELVLTRDEHTQTGDGSSLDALNDAIFDMQDRLDPKVQGIYSRLYKKSHIVMAAMSNGCCSGCGMQVPIAQSQQVRLAQHLVTCSSCGRILYAADADEARNIADKPAPGEDPKTGISRFSAEELMVPSLKGKTAAEAIGELAAAMEASRFISNADSLAAAAMERESVLSTAMPSGVAFPHVRGVEGGALTLAIGCSRSGIDWAGQKVHIVVLSAIPVAVSAFYLRLMASLGQAFAHKDTHAAVLAAETPAAMWKAIVKATRRTVK